MVVVCPQRFQNICLKKKKSGELAAWLWKLIRVHLFSNCLLPDPLTKKSASCSRVSSPLSFFFLPPNLVFSLLSASWALQELPCERGSSRRMRRHPRRPRRPEARGPTTRVASVGAAAAAAPGTSPCPADAAPELRVDTRVSPRSHRHASVFPLLSQAALMGDERWLSARLSLSKIECFLGIYTGIGSEEWKVDLSHDFFHPRLWKLWVTVRCVAMYLLNRETTFSPIIAGARTQRESPAVLCRCSVSVLCSFMRHWLFCRRFELQPQPQATQKDRERSAADSRPQI